MMRSASSRTAGGTSSTISGVCSPTMTLPLTSKLTRTTTLPVTTDARPVLAQSASSHEGLISGFCKALVVLASINSMLNQMKTDKSLDSGNPSPVAFGSDVISLPIGALLFLEDFPFLESAPCVTTACSLLLVSDSIAFGTVHSRRTLDTAVLSLNLFSTVHPLACAHPPKNSP